MVNSPREMKKSTQGRCLQLLGIDADVVLVGMFVVVGEDMTIGNENGRSFWHECHSGFHCGAYELSEYPIGVNLTIAIVAETSEG